MGNYTLTCGDVTVESADPLELFPVFWNECERRWRDGDTRLFLHLPLDRQHGLLAPHPEAGRG
jgi:hypothetical protein